LREFPKTLFSPVIIPSLALARIPKTLLGPVIIPSLALGRNPVLPYIRAPVLSFNGSAAPANFDQVSRTPVINSERSTCSPTYFEAKVLSNLADYNSDHNPAQ
jgi:hypothetical protein